MKREIFEIIGDMVKYIVNIRLIDLPDLIVDVGLSALVGYCAAMILIAFPVAVYETITKKNVNDEIEDKIIKIVAICFFIILLCWLLYESSLR